MTKSTIRTYDDLLEEKARLKALLQAQKELVHQDFLQIKEEFQPVRNAISFVGKFTTRDKSNPLLTTATETIIDLVVKRLILSKSGWLTKMVVPFLAKNISSHFVAGNQGKIFASIFSLFSKKHKDADAGDGLEEEEEDLTEEEFRPGRAAAPMPEEPLEERAI